MRYLPLIVALLVCVPTVSQSYIADYRVAKEDVLRSIPVEYINKARNTFKIAYQHTSHGTHVSYGMYGLPDYKVGDESLFAISRDEVVEGKLAMFDYAIEPYSDDANNLADDLSTEDESAFIQATRNYLDDPVNADVNVVMWAWCSIRNHDIEGVYLPGMQALIDEYGPGGTKIGTEAGKRANAVHFIFMTGHASDSGNIGDGEPANQSELVNAYCRQKGLMCLDYYSIDSHCMADNYWDDAGDDGNSYKYNNSTVEEGYFYQDWQDAHVLGTDYYENKVAPGAYVRYGQHTTQHITSNRKAYAMWWILARLAGWNDQATSVSFEVDKNGLIFSAVDNTLSVDDALVGTSVLSIYNLTGSLVFEQAIVSNSVEINRLTQGVYIALVKGTNGSFTKKFVVHR